MITTTAQSNRKHNSRGGFSLVELMIVTGLLSIIIAGGLSAVTFIAQSSKALTNYTLMSTSGRKALEIVARDLRMGYDINYASSTSLDFEIYGKAGNTDNVVYTYDADADILYRKENTDPQEIVLSDLTSFTLSYYNLRREPTTAKISIKEVQLEGLMRKKALRISNTNHIISARYMMRNRAVSD